MITLRPYQQECIEKVFKHLETNNNALVVLPTAGGKTVIFGEIIKLIRASNELAKILIVSDKVSLVEQNKNSLAEKTGIETSVYCGSLRKNETNITSASIQTLLLETPIQNLSVCILDEAHRYMSKKRLDYINGLMAISPGCKFIWFTATPWRSDGVDDGFIWGKSGVVVNEPTFRKTSRELAEKGYILRPVFSSTKNKFDCSKLKKSSGDFLLKELSELVDDEDKIKLQVEDALSRLEDRKKIVWACTNIKHAEQLKKEIEKTEPCLIIHSKLDKNNGALDSFVNTNIRNIASVTMLSEGVDIPPVDAIVIMRPTRSPVLYVQLVGRGLRLFPDKKDCIVLDYGGVVNALGDPNDPYIRKKGERSQDVDRSIECEKCGYVIFKYPCSECGFIRPQRIRQVTKNLSVEAHSGSTLWSSPSKIYFGDYVSKTGNKCKKISYVIGLEIVVEYFRIDQAWSMSNFRNRAALIRANPTDKIKCLIGMENGYKKIKEMRVE
jgi:DNA repair protein RadD